MAKNKTQRQKSGKKIILFPRKEVKPKKFEEDIILAFNEMLQKVGELILICFSRVSYS